VNLVASIVPTTSHTSEPPAAQEAPSGPQPELVPPPLPDEAVGILRGKEAVGWWRNTLDHGLREQLSRWSPPEVPTPPTGHALWLAVAPTFLDGRDAEIIGWGATPEAAHRCAEQDVLHWMSDPVQAARAFDTPPNSPWLYFQENVRFVQLRGEQRLIELVARTASRQEPVDEVSSFEVAAEDGNRGVTTETEPTEEDRAALRSALCGVEPRMATHLLLDEMSDASCETLLLRMCPTPAIRAVVDAFLAARARRTTEDAQPSSPEASVRARCCSRTALRGGDVPSTPAPARRLRSWVVRSKGRRPC
jgi:hypothetical protein